MHEQNLTMHEQLKEIAPSAKEPLFRRLMCDETLAYLRDKNSIIGFEIDLKTKQQLAGFTLIAIQKHTIYAYHSDIGEEPRLVLFPPLDKLFDQEFDMLRLIVTKKRFTDMHFQGEVLDFGQFDTLVKDLTPPEKQVDIPSSISDKMVEHMKKIRDREMVVETPAPTPEIPVRVKETDAYPAQTEDVTDYSDTYDDGMYDDGLNDFEEDPYEGFESNYEHDFEDDTFSHGYREDTTLPDDDTVDPRSIKLKGQSFMTLSEVSEYVSNQLGVSKALSTQVVNRALQSAVDPKFRVELAVKLFEKMFNEKKI